MTQTTRTDTSGARAEILRRIRHALDDGGARAAVDAAPASVPAEPASEPTEANASGGTDHEEMIGRFAEVTADYRAVVERCGPQQLAGTIEAALQANQVGSVVIPPGLDREWLSAVTADLIEDEHLTTADLDHCDAVVTAAAVAIAETGTIVLDHTPDQGRRALTLVPDVHVCVVRESQVTPDVPDAIHLLRPAIDAHRALTWISGPSATSDIELNRIEGVHGPRHLHVIVLSG